MFSIFKKIFSSANQRRIDAYEKIVKEINSIEDQISKLEQEDFKNLNHEHKELNLVLNYGTTGTYM